MKNFRVMYLREGSGRPVGCVAIKFGKKRDEVEYQISVQNPQDNFEKPVARHLALGRLVESPISVKVDFIGSVPTMHDISEAVMDDIRVRTGVPSRARKAAAAWLRQLYSVLDRA